MGEQVVYQPWRGPWQVAFIPLPLHWMTTIFHKPKAPWQHCLLMQPGNDGSSWLIAEWSFLGYSATIQSPDRVARLHAIIERSGALLAFEGSETPPKPSIWHAWQPTTCVTYVRSILGLPPRSFTYAADRFYDELLGLGAIELIPPPQRRA